MKAAEWIDRVKVSKGFDSDYRAGKELGFSRNTISNFRCNRNATMDESSAMKVAHALDLDPAIVLADQAMERAKDGEARTAWASILERLGGVAAGLLVCVGVNPALLDDVAALCALCKPDDASPAPSARPSRRPGRRAVMASMARTLSTQAVHI